MQTEIFDVFDETMHKIGQESRGQVHAKGLWHQTFHCWILNNASDRLRLLFQLRHKDKDIFPSLLDISCAGHLQAGESAEDGVRELEEELGLSVDFKDLVYCGRVAQEYVLAEDLIDREFNHVFLYKCDLPLEDYRVQESEVSGLYWIDYREFKELIGGVRASISAEGFRIEEASGTYKNETRPVALENFTPNDDAYYQLLFEKVEAYE